MLCDVCKCNDATVFLTQILEGKMQKVNLCDACSKEKGVQDPTGFALADLLLGIGAAEEIEKGAPTQKCPVCGFSQADFKKTGTRGTSGSELLFQFLPLPRCLVANPRARSRLDLARPSLWSMHRRDSPFAFCLPEFASGRPSRHCICKRHTTSLLITPCWFGNIQPQYFHDVSTSEAAFSISRRKLVYRFRVSPDGIAR